MESRSAAARTPGSPARFHREYRANATVTLPRTGSQTEIRDPLKVLRALVSGVLRGRQRAGGGPGGVALETVWEMLSL